jgi:hypothetical protein
LYTLDENAEELHLFRVLKRKEQRRGSHVKGLLNIIQFLVKMWKNVNSE